MAASKKPFFERLASAWDQVFPSTKEEGQKGVEITYGNRPQPEAYWPGTGTSSRLLYAGSFNGEKNLGEMGPIKYFLMDYISLSLRSWQAYIESAEAQTVLNKFCTWVIGRGLKLQSEPVKSLLSKRNNDLKKFSDDVESRWSVYANSKKADHSERKTLNQLSRAAYKNAIIGGDLLVLLRYDECVTVQLVDGAHVQSPLNGSEWFPSAAKNGNRIINGIEIDNQGRHVAYYVRKPYDSMNVLSPLDYDRIPAKGKKTGILMAFMVYGLEYRLDTHRGIPLLTAVLEKLKKLERYEEATLASAEEQAKIAYQITHDVGGSGQMPFSAQIAAAHNPDGDSDLPTDSVGNDLANKVIATTNKQIVNNPPGAEIKPMRDTKTQLYFKDFLDKYVDIVCACIEIPPNVAMSRYDSNYSASRAAIKDWEHTLSVKRSDFSSQFLQPIYNFFLEIEILKNNIQAPGYLIAKSKGDDFILDSYRTARWVGAPVANIDPVKEVEAERKKLGITAESIPLTTIEAATEALSGGDSDHNMEQYAEELDKSKDLGLRPEPEVKQQSVVTDK